MRAPLFFALLLLASCSKPARPATEKDLQALEFTLQLTGKPDSSNINVSEQVLQTLSELDLGRTEKCRDWLGTVLVAQGQVHHVQAVKVAAAECHFPCAPSDFEGMTTPAIAKDCGPDPLLPALTPAERDALTPVNYVWLRGLVEQTRIGLSLNQNEKARKLEKQLADQLPRAIKASVWK